MLGINELNQEIWRIARTEGKHQLRVQARLDMIKEILNQLQPID